jgi:DNA mismatch endonuclease (patch repair protein)
MAAVRSTNNRAESALRKNLWKRGFRYRLYDSTLPGKPDLVFPGARAVIFVDGDFWHGRQLIEGKEQDLRDRLRTSRQDWWVAKIKRNVERDANNMRRLQSDGWRILRLWESEVNEDVVSAGDRAMDFLREAYQEVDAQDPGP